MPISCDFPCQVVSIEGPTKIVGKALSGAALQELALLHLPGAHKVGTQA